MNKKLILTVILVSLFIVSSMPIPVDADYEFPPYIEVELPDPDTTAPTTVVFTFLFFIFVVVIICVVIFSRRKPRIIYSRQIDRPITTVDRVFIICPYCGSKTEQGITRCQNCGAEL